MFSALLVACAVPTELRERKLDAALRHVHAQLGARLELRVRLAGGQVRVLEQLTHLRRRRRCRVRVSVVHQRPCQVGSQSLHICILVEVHLRLYVLL
jgi:hypothetical protein